MKRVTNEDRAVRRHIEQKIVELMEKQDNEKDYRERRRLDTLISHYTRSLHELLNENAWYYKEREEN